MHRVASRRWLNRALSPESSTISNSIPLFLCPAFAQSRISGHRHLQTATVTRVARSPTSARAQQRRNNSTTAPAETAPAEIEEDVHITVDGQKVAGSYLQEVEAKLPVMCPGCGAFTQSSDFTQLGYYNPNAIRVEEWVKGRNLELPPSKKKKAEDANQIMARLDPEKLKELGLNPDFLMAPTDLSDTPEASVPINEPFCDRCHDLQHNNGYTSLARNVKVYHPTVEALRETIEESPHKYNHVYHVIDAADFPMSLLPRLNVLLGDIQLRSKNRRSRSIKYRGDKQTEMSFIITRTDLLAPTKEKVDSLMPWMRKVLTTALGRLGDRVRLGNVMAVSAQRGWWTKPLKEEIWKRGGAGWMVGKFNVGKSALFEVVHPKGRLGNWSHETGEDKTPLKELQGPQKTPEEIRNTLEYGDLLPPAQPSKMYPVMPLVSSLPGTTASPIRVPFGNGKGELIDLPGLQRSTLDQYVNDERNQKRLLMRSRIVPEQVSMSEGRSLLLGGALIQIKPITPGLTFLAYNFTPLPEHLTSNWKVAEYMSGLREFGGGAENWATLEAGINQKLAKTVRLKFDVTKLRAGPLTTKQAVGFKPEQLPFRVLSADILIEGVGYVEVVAQVRAKQFARMQAKQAREDALEAVKEEQEKEEEYRERYGRERPVITTPKPAPAPEVVAADPFLALAHERVDGRGGRKPARDRVTSKLEDQVAPKVEDLRNAPIDDPDFEDWPTVEVYTPEGNCISTREPLQGWLHNRKPIKPEHRRARPRPSMKGRKKQDKLRARAAAASSSETAW